MAGLNVAELRAALEARLLTVAGVPPATHWAKENADLASEDAAGEELIGASDPDLRMLLGFDDGDRKEQPASASRVWHTGTWHLSLGYPADRGSADADTVAQAMVNAFADGLYLTSGTTTVRITKVGRRAGYQVKGRWIVPVKIRWEVITDNTL